MPVTDYERNQVFNWFEEHMGKERARAMMAMLPPAGWADVAMKRDLDAIEARLAAGFKADLFELRSDLQRTFVGWMVGMHAALVAMIGIMVAVMALIVE